MYILFDIGGTSTRIGISREGKTVDAELNCATPTSFEEAITLYRNKSEELLSGAKAEKIAAGVKFLNAEKTGMFAQKLLPDWSGKPLKDRIVEAFGAPAILENDAAVVGLGEALSGAGKGHSIVVYVTVSTGVGGLRIVDGAIDRSSLGFEPGHMIVNSDERDCHCPSCGVLGDLESYISGVAFERKFGKKPFEVMDEAVWEDAAKTLAVGIANIVLLWSPDVVVVGGSMMKRVGIKLAAVERHLKERLTVFPKLPPLKSGELGDSGGLAGALALVHTVLR